MADSLDQHAADRRRHARRAGVLVLIAVLVPLATRRLLGPPEPDEVQVRRVEAPWPRSLPHPQGMPSGTEFLWFYEWRRSGLFYPWIEQYRHTMIAAAGDRQVAVTLSDDELRLFQLGRFPDSRGVSDNPRLAALTPAESLARGPGARRVLWQGILGDALILASMVTGVFALRACARTARAHVSLRRVRTGHCPRCSYPKPADAAVCPECGEPLLRTG